MLACCWASGLGGATYVVIVLRRARRQTDYQPVMEDWLFHTVFPLVSYTALLVAALLLPGHPAPALFVIAAATVLLLFIGIHNAWDNVTYTAIELSGPRTRARTSMSLAPVRLLWSSAVVSRQTFGDKTCHPERSEGSSSLDGKI